MIQVTKKNNVKLDQGKAWLIENDVDVACWIELGVPWHRNRRKYHLPQLMKKPSWESQIAITANNSHEHTGKRQFGGTATLLFNKVTSAIAGTGYDSSGLGHWSWARLQGRGNWTTTIITAYNPCKSNNERPSTVYTQQKQYLISVNRDVCPREALCTDLSDFITLCQRRQESIILCIDLNEDTNRNDGPLQQTLLRNNNLIDVM